MQTEYIRLQWKLLRRKVYEQHQKIDATIKKFEANYAVRDKQDVLAMCALQFASQIEQTQIDTSTDTIEAFERLKNSTKNRRFTFKIRKTFIQNTKVLPTLVNI